jgi:hypothetical protein
MTEQILWRVSGDAGMASSVISGAFLRIIEDGIGFGDFLEAFLGAGLLVAIGMVFERQLAEGILDCLLIPRHARRRALRNSRVCRPWVPPIARRC